jgi:uncharacterized membrane protein
MKKNRMEKKSELFAGRLVQFLVIIAALISGASGIFFLVTSGQNASNYSTFTGSAEYLRSVQGIIRSALSLNSAAIMQLGILVLISIPVIRVAVFLFSFLRERDWTYVIISTIVMGILLYSLLGGK